MVVRGPTNQHTKQLIIELEQLAVSKKAPIWKKCAYILSKPTRQRPEVNLYKISASKAKVVVVPGTVMSIGQLESAVTVAAFKFTSQAKEKIQNAKGKAITISELAKANPTGKDIVILV